MTATVRRSLVAALTVAVVGWPALPAFGADLTPQQQKMSSCAKANKGKKGDDYKKAQSDCLKGGDATAAAAPMTQQEKMSMCSKQNKGKKGDDYKKAQSDCLKG